MKPTSQALTKLAAKNLPQRCNQIKTHLSLKPSTKTIRIYIRDFASQKIPTRWAPTIVMNGVTRGPYKWPYNKWVTGVVALYSW